MSAELVQGSVLSRCAALSATSTLCPPLTAAPRCAKGSALVAPAKDGIRDPRGGDETPQLSGHDPDSPRLLGRARLRDPPANIGRAQCRERACMTVYI